MPVGFLPNEQRESYGRYTVAISSDDLARYFHLDDADQALIAKKRGDYNRFGFAVQLCTVRYLSTFLDDPLDVPVPVMQTLANQLGIEVEESLRVYSIGEQRWQHAAEIRTRYGYVEITEHKIGFRLTRWLYSLCWTGTDRPSVLFERATTWLITHKVLLPGYSTLERYIASLRNRVEKRLWQSLCRGISSEQQARLEKLLVTTDGTRNSLLDRLRTGPVMISGPSLVQALLRLHSVRELGIKLPTAHIPTTRLAALARYASTAKVSAILRLPPQRRLASLVAFVHCLEATAQDDALEVLEALLRDLFNAAIRADKKARLRTLKDLDKAAATLANACQILLDTGFPDVELRTQLFEKIPRDTLAQAVDGVIALIRPADDVYYLELDAKYRTVRRFLPTLLEHIRFGANSDGKPVIAAYDWLRSNITLKKPGNDAPLELADKSWQKHVQRDDNVFDLHAYTFCVLEKLQTALRRRDVFVEPSWRYADPRAGLLKGEEWETTRPTYLPNARIIHQPRIYAHGHGEQAGYYIPCRCRQTA